MSDADDLRRLVATKFAVSPIIAGRVLGLGRRRSRAAVTAGVIPTNVAGLTPTSWIRAQLAKLDALDTANDESA